MPLVRPSCHRLERARHKSVLFVSRKILLTEIHAQKMQRPQLDGEHFTESSASLVNSAEQEIPEDKELQTAGIVAGPEMEFVQTHYSPRGVLLMYFRGDAATEVDKHFNRTFAELCCLPSSTSSENRMECSHLQGRFLLNKIGVSKLPFKEINLYIAHCHLAKTGACVKIYLSLPSK